MEAGPARPPRARDSLTSSRRSGQPQHAASNTSGRGIFARLRERLDASAYLPIAYLGFVAGFFFMPDSNLHNLLYYLLVMLPYWLTLRRGRLTELSSSSVLTFSLAYLALLALSVSWSNDPQPSQFERYLMHLLYLGSFLAMSVELCLRAADFVVRLQRVLAVSAALTALASIVIFYLGEHPEGQRLVGFGRLDETNLAAAVYGSVALLAVHLGALNRDEPRRWRIFSALSATACVLFLLLSASRGPQVAFLLAALTAFVLGGRPLLALGIAASALAYGVLGMMEAVPLGRFATAGASYRTEIWSAAWSHILEHPLLGHGQNFRPEYISADGNQHAHPHSVYVASLLYSGLVGTALALGAMIRAIRVPLSAPRSPQHWGISVLLVFAMLCMAFDDHKLLGHPREIWMYFWLPMALAAALELHRRRSGGCQETGP